jgi:hypothetical protein
MSAVEVAVLVVATTIALVVMSGVVVLGRLVPLGAVRGVAVMPVAAVGHRLRRTDREAQGEAAQADQQQPHCARCSVPAHR